MSPKTLDHYLPCFSGTSKPLRVPGLQDQAERPHLRLDLQPQDEGEGLEVGPRRSGLAPTDLSYCHCAEIIIIDFVYECITTVIKGTSTQMF